MVTRPADGRLVQRRLLAGGTSRAAAVRGTGRTSRGGSGQNRVVSEPSTTRPPRVRARGPIWAEGLYSGSDEERFGDLIQQQAELATLERVGELKRWLSALSSSASAAA